jgi:hypothetical protein
MLGRLGLGGLIAIGCVTGCHDDFDTKHTPPPRGTVGEEVFGMLCDRVGAQALREDLTGASFKDLCHKRADGTYADAVDESRLPAIREDAKNAQGQPVSVEAQTTARTRSLGRIHALARRRGDLVAALDAMVPDIELQVKDLQAADSCGPSEKKSTMPDEVAAMLGRFIDLYNDGTIPESTRSLSKVVEAFRTNEEAQKAWARFDSRRGYRPVELGMGAIQPVVSYPRLRDLANATLRVMSSDSKPYDPDAKYDENGRIPTPGYAYAPFTKTLEAAFHELKNVTPSEKSIQLTSVVDKTAGYTILSRPRTALELAEELLFVQDPALGMGSSRYIVRRDPRGYAQLAGGELVAPFLDNDKDGLPDVDDLGRFAVAGGAQVPAPFFHLDVKVQETRDKFGRAVLGNKLLYDYLDTSHTFAAQMMLDVKPLLNPDPAQKHETLMDAFAGAYVLLGPRDGEDKTEKVFKTGTVKYNQFKGDKSPLLDVLYAVMQLLGDKGADDVLAMSKTLMAKNEGDLANLVGELLKARDIANKHPEAKIPPKAMFWDEALDILAKAAAEPGLLEDLIRAMEDPQSQRLGTVYSNYSKYRDRVSYDRNNLNGPVKNMTTGKVEEPKTLVDRSKPATGDNRSMMQRFLSMIADTADVTSCNRPNAKVHAKLFGFSLTLPTKPLMSDYKECSVFKIENMAKFYVNAMVGHPTKGRLWIRDSFMRGGVLGLGAANVDLMEQSSLLTGFYTPGNSKELRPKPEWLNRLVMFDIQGDTTNKETQLFLSDLNGEYFGSAVCPERTIDDPCAGESSCGANTPFEANVSSDGKVHGLRQCANGDWLQQRAKDDIFSWELYGFYDAMRPMLKAFSDHDREDLFIELAKLTNKHWADAAATENECKTGPGQKCARTGIVTYEPAISEMLMTDLLPALGNATKVMEGITIKHCEQTDPKTRACTKTVNMDGVQVMANAARAALSPEAAKAIGLTDRRGNKTGRRNDGTSTPQVTTALLLANALSDVDAAFEEYAATHPGDTNRQAQWKSARSQLMDQFVRVQGKGSSARFANQSIPKMTPVLVDLLRGQIWAHCPDSFVPPYKKCKWLTEETVAKVNDIVKGPLFAGAMDVADAVRKDDEARRELEALGTFLLDAASQNDALPAVLASANDVVQILRDETNLLPFYAVMAEAAAPTKRDEKGRITEKSLADAQLALLARISGKAFDKDGKQVCNKELDPNQVLNRMLANVVTPMKTPDGKTPGRTPLEVVIEVIAEVNRVEPQKRDDKLSSDDYKSIADNVTDFLSNKERGMEQFYETIKKGTVK